MTRKLLVTIALGAALAIIAAGTATLEIYVGNTKTDLATTDTLYMTWIVRNSGRNA